MPHFDSASQSSSRYLTPSRSGTPIAASTIDARALPAPDKFGHVVRVVNVERDALEFDHPASGFRRRGLHDRTARLSGPKCEGKRSGGRRRIAFVPVPSREGTRNNRRPVAVMFNDCLDVACGDERQVNRQSQGGGRAAFLRLAVEIN